MAPKVAIIGLDCAEPSLVFDKWLGDLPNLRSLVTGGSWGPLRTIDPPISVPAWSCMASSRDPGELGVYGFRNRKDHSYGGLAFADSRWVQVERLWDTLGAAGRHVIALGVPQTYPPLPVNGEMVSCFLTPDPRKHEYTHPPHLRTEIESLVGPYQVDVQNFRSDDRDRILREIYDMTEQRFAVARHLLTTRPWDFFWMVEIGLDRIQHAFWRYLDQAHPRFEAHPRYSDAIRSYYQYLDDQVGELLELFDDETTVLVVSDHGAQPMEGGICVNEWLVQEGYLALREQPAGDERLSFSQAKVDWSRTRAWGEGGYYCRLCLNVQGREPEGVVAPGDYEKLRDELIARLEALPGPDGQSIGTRVFRPEELWPVRNGIAPDLVVYFGNLAWRSVGSLGHGQIHTFENDTGPDDANHSAHGLFVMSGPRVSSGRRDSLRIYDVAPTVLDIFGTPCPGGDARPGRGTAVATHQIDGTIRAALDAMSAGVGSAGATIRWLRLQL